jgi:hypothetical protein
MERLRSHWMDCHEIWYLSIFWKFVKKFQVFLKSNKKNGYFTWRQIYISDRTCHSFSMNEKHSDKSCTENQNTHFKNSNSFKKSGCLWDNVKIVYSWRGHRWLYGACTFHAVYFRLQTHTHAICNTYCFLLWQWLQEHASMLCYTYNACLVILHLYRPENVCNVYYPMQNNFAIYQK